MAQMVSEVRTEIYGLACPLGVAIRVAKLPRGEPNKSLEKSGWGGSAESLEELRRSEA